MDGGRVEKRDNLAAGLVFLQQSSEGFPLVLHSDTDSILSAKKKENILKKVQILLSTL